MAERPVRRVYFVDHAGKFVGHLREIVEDNVIFQEARQVLILFHELHDEAFF